MSTSPSQTTFESIAGRAAPAVFVVLWSTGFIGTKYVLAGAEPLTYLAVRMAIAAVLMGVIAAIWRAKWPRGADVFHSAVSGLLVHGFYLGGTSVAIYHSVPAGLSALIPGLQPILMSTLANRWLGERVTLLQWTGLFMGLAGTLTVLHGRNMSGDAGWGWLATCVALLSITLGTLYQKRYCSQIDWRSGNCVQFFSAALLFTAGAFLFETRVIVWNRELVFGLMWLVLVLSIGSIGLLYWLIRHSAATRVASFFYLVPGTTALMAYLLFDERLDMLSIAGMAICAAAVLLVNKGTTTTRS